MKLQYDSNEQFKLTLPKSLLEALKWQKGDSIKIELAQEKLVLVNSSKGEDQ
ncbi:AbrB/MazE/SpoVT family DNA-binding domain-containing protein [Candidatus Woesearchaeota archaeon]|nr:AbrB/MazE/SpoVT family DNA-binding domain-containing protein [Candidatus Woesearchaeota archaeon]